MLEEQSVQVDAEEVDGIVPVPLQIIRDAQQECAVVTHL